jgi:L-fuculose-phosphate aldolase
MELDGGLSDKTMIASRILEEIQAVGRMTCKFGLNSSHSGNLSVRVGDRVVITKALAMLGRLDEHALAEVPLKGAIDSALNASKESLTHRAIYERCKAKAIVHTHPPAAITLSLLYDSIAPVDADGAYHFPKVDVVAPNYLEGPEAVAEVIGTPFATANMALSRGHGLFVAEESLGRALQFSCVVETSARIICNLLAMGKDPRDFEKDYFGKWRTS